MCYNNSSSSNNNILLCNNGNDFKHACGINRRFRWYRYTLGDVYR